ncbi:uncharacterized protein [Choristoneura fumiferana]|uniref:uncharacterized protein n=1 Tax=Choristoneura fumiferana TaxID=7141 RepID=UPI003D153CF2
MMSTKEIISISNNKNRPAVLCDGYRYNWVKDNVSGNTFWRCANREECSASITLNPNQTEVVRGSLHSCVQNHHIFIRDIVVHAAKKKVCGNMAPVKKIYEKIILKHVQDDETIEMMPSFESVRNKLHRARKRFLEVSAAKFPKSIDVEIPNTFRKNFLVAEYELDSENKICLFSTATCKMFAMSASRQNKVFFGDGTFKPVPSSFTQLFSIHVDGASDKKNMNVFPMLYALKYKCDFEMAQMNAFQEVFPQGKVTGCYFHFSKAVWSKADALHFANSDQGKQIVRLVCNLPLLPSSLINDGWNSITNYAMNCEGMTAFTQYFEAQWLKNTALISCCKERHRTNNAMEAWHRRLCVRLHSKTTLFGFLHKLKNESRYQDIRVKGLLTKKENRKKRT